MLLYKTTLSLLAAAMNSQYGTLGAEAGYLPCKAAAAAVTATGRNMIQKTKECVESKFGATAIYGDSVAPYTPILIRNSKGEMRIVRIDVLAEHAQAEPWAKRTDKKFICRFPFDQDACHVWTDAGWTQILQVVRHRTRQPLIRVVTTTGCVDVTEQHSLLTAAGDAVGPASLIQGDELMNRPFSGEGVECRCSMSAADAEAEGKTMWMKGIYPDLLLMDTLDVRESFWRGFEAVWPGYIYLTESNQLACAFLYQLVLSIGLSPHLDSQTRFTVTEKGPLDSLLSGVVLKTTRVRGCEWVYDITTANSHFQAGFGALIVHNTDSIFITLPPGQPFKSLFPLGHTIAETASALFPPPVTLLFEKAILSSLHSANVTQWALT